MVSSWDDGLGKAKSVVYLEGLDFVKEVDSVQLLSACTRWQALVSKMYVMKPNDPFQNGKQCPTDGSLGEVAITYMSSDG